MKTYVLTLSKSFLKGHPKSGLPTYFQEKLAKGEKLHTIRGNYPFWQKRVQDIQEGKACLSVRQWTGEAYKSPQIEILRLTKENYIGVQKLHLHTLNQSATIDDNIKIELPDLAKNDGLSFNDWYYWFRGYVLNQPMAIIHFTNFRYKA